MHRSLVVALIVWIAVSVSGQDIRYAGDVLRLPAGSDIAALGDAGVALPRHAASVWWNPSAPVFFKQREISIEVADLYQGLSQQGCFAFSSPVQAGVSAAVLYLPFFSGDIALQDSLPGATYEERLANPELRSDGMAEGVFQNYHHVVLLSLGKLFSLSLPRPPGVSYPRPFDIGIGCNFKGYWQTMNPRDKVRMGMNINLDAGATFSIGLDYDLVKKETSRRVLLGVALRDFLPSPVVWVHSPDEYQEPVKSTQHYGVSYIDRSGEWGGNWVATFALQKEYDLTYHAGIEGEFWNTVAFRAGLSNRVPSLGAGIHYRHYFLDYTFRFDDLAWSFFRLTLGAQF
jgi:hypothetical protein